MQFIFPPLTWAFLLVLLPVLIHLINLVRQQRVKWAAMEFLLQSHKRHRHWIWLKQLLLLLLRMLAIAVAVAMLAGLVTRSAWSLLGNQTTHHFVLLDDSMSMGDRGGSSRAFDRALQVVTRLGEQLQSSRSSQKISLVRFSRADRYAGPSESQVDLNAFQVDSQFIEQLEQRIKSFDLTELALGPRSSLKLAQQLVMNVPERNRIVYVISDFRAGEWQQTSELREALGELKKQGAEIHLIRCAEEQHPNVSLVELHAESGTLAAGVPWLVNVKVKNQGPTAAQQIQIRLSARSYPEGILINSQETPTESQVTTMVIDELPAGEQGVRQTQFKFDRPGQYVIEAKLNSDALLEDNLRRLLVHLPSSIPVLLIDGDASGSEAFYLDVAFAPGRIATGIQPVIRPTTYLRDASDEELGQYAVIYLLNIDQLDSSAVALLDRFVRNGGGLAFFTGPLSSPRVLNELYADGNGIFPIAITNDQATVRPAGTHGADIQVSDHSIFRVLVAEGGENRPLAGTIRIDRYFPPDPQWSPSGDTKILARLQGSAPLVVTKSLGSGHIVAFLTTASPTWNNWALGPSFPVVLLQLHDFLSATRDSHIDRLTGEPIVVTREKANYQNKLSFHIPSPISTSDATPLDEISLLPSRDNGTKYEFVLGVPGDNSNTSNTNNSQRSGETDRSGIYVAQATTLEGEISQERFVVNVPNSEGALSLVSSQQLSNQFKDLDLQIHTAAEFSFGPMDQDEMTWGQWLSFMLVILLLVEQVLAYSASYHPPAGVRA